MYTILTKFKYASDIIKFRNILKIKNKHKKEYFDKDGCGLEIEFGIDYSAHSAVYIATGLRKLKECVDGDGKFVTDNTIGCDMNVEIVLNPLNKEALKEKLETISGILNYYENFVINEHCGVHANFRADAAKKEAFYNLLISGAYDSSKFIHNKYKVDFLSIAKNSDGTYRTYEEFIAHQDNISAKYIAVNFLKEYLIEFRALDLNWESIEYVIDLYESL